MSSIKISNRVMSDRMMRDSKDAGIARLLQLTRNKFIGLLASGP
jgi:hypothetical protein